MDFYRFKPGAVVDDENDDVVSGAVAVLWMMNWSDYRPGIITIVGLSGKAKLNDQGAGMPLHSKNAMEYFWPY